MKSDAYIRVSCDRCGYETEIELTATVRGGYDDRYVGQHLKRDGWSTEGGDFCEDCASAEEDDEAAESEEAE